jgi:NADH-quinone oxidoreductase subunit L
MSFHNGNHPALTSTTALTVVTWVGAITAVFAASIAVAQDDIKRILAYSTVSQLGYMMLGLGVGGVAVGMFHLITHAFFKALLFMGAGSVIHGCHEEQNIRRMGGLRKLMPVTFATYAVGMLALCGFPLFFSGFWSKDAILHAASLWSVSRVPFYLGTIGVLLTAFYMTRQVCYVFFGKPREVNSILDTHHSAPLTPHESPAVMTGPLLILAAFSILIGLIGTPAWPWFTSFLEGQRANLDFGGFAENGVLTVMLSSTAIFFLGLGLGWLLYGHKPIESAQAPDTLERFQPQLFNILRNAFFVDELYKATVVRFNTSCARAADWLDRWVWGGAVRLVTSLVLGLSSVDQSVDALVVNPGFDQSCLGVTRGSQFLSRLQNGRTQNYLRMVGIAFAVLVIFLIWGKRG